MTGRLLRVALVLGIASVAGPAVAFAQTACDAPSTIAGVKDSPGLALLMTGVPHDRGLRVGRVSYLNYNDITLRTKTVALAAFQPIDVGVEANGSLQRVRASFVTSSYFDVLGTSLQHGREFNATDDVPGQAPLIAVISDRLWLSMFDRSPAAVGQRIAVNGNAVTIVGIASAEFHGVRGPRFEEDVWLPGVTLAALNGEPGLRSDDRGSGGYYQFVARLNDGATWPDAHAELGSLTTWLAETYPAANGKFWEVGFHDVGPLGCANT